MCMRTQDTLTNIYICMHPCIYAVVVIYYVVEYIDYNTWKVSGYDQPVCHEIVNSQSPKGQAPLHCKTLQTKQNKRSRRDIMGDGNGSNVHNKTKKTNPKLYEPTIFFFFFFFFFLLLLLFFFFYS